jgi:hypothetical protein
MFAGGERAPHGNGQWTVDNGQLGRVGRDDPGAPPVSRFVFKPERIFNMPFMCILHQFMMRVNMPFFFEFPHYSVSLHITVYRLMNLT